MTTVRIILVFAVFFSLYPVTHEMEPLRICFVEIPGAMERAIPHLCTSRGCYLKGVAGPAVEMLANDILWYKTTFNATVSFYDSFGVREPDGSYSGCLGSM